jgi:acyl-CoA thioesterase
MDDLPKEVRERLELMVEAPFAALCGMELVSLGPRTARVRLSLEGRQNALGGMHGGALFALADQAFALAANQGENVYVAMNASIHYLRPARGTVEAEARLVGESGRTSLYEVRIFQGDEVVAIFQGTGYRLQKKLI